MHMFWGEDGRHLISGFFFELKWPFGVSQGRDFVVYNETRKMANPRASSVIFI